MKEPRGCGLIPWLVAAAIGVGLMRFGLASAAENPAGQPINVTLNAGETYVIKNLNHDATPGIMVKDNPQALIVHTDKPGEIVLLGTEAGEWQIKAERADGTPVTYDVSVHAIASPFKKPLVPGKAPKAMSEAGLSGSEGETSPNPLDSGAGPMPAKVANAAASATSPSSSPAAASSSSASSHAADTSSATAAPATASSATAVVPAGKSGGAVAAASPSIPAANAAPAGVMESQAASAATPAVKHFRTDPRATLPAPGAYANANNNGRSYLPANGIDLMADTSQVFDFPSRMVRVSIADSKIADIQVINPFQINLIAHKPGFTTLAVWDDQGHYVERQVRVDSGGKQQVLLNVIVAELNRTRLEQQGINYSVALTHLGFSIASLPGTIATPFTTSQITTVGNGLQQVVAGPTYPQGGNVIPMLLSQNVTYGITGQNNNVNSQALFQFLETHGLAKILAQPRLLANSGQKAQFLSGGEIPIVVAQALNTSIVFKQFGTSVSFLPTVVGRDQIELAVKPEVSEPDYAHGVQLFGFTVPAFVTRRAQTMVRLRNDQTLIIAGLILDSKLSTVQKVPYLGDIPYAGALFRNTSYNDTKTDLVMSVTPQIVRPLPSYGQVALPTDVGPLTRAQIKTRSLPHYDASRPRF